MGDDPSNLDYLADLPPPTMEKYISTNISDQGIFVSCWAHTETRILLKAFYKLMPEIFKITQTQFSSQCDRLFDSYYYEDYEDYIDFISFYYEIDACSMPNFKNVLFMYIYIYRYLIWLQRTKNIPVDELSQDRINLSPKIHNLLGERISFGWDTIIKNINERELEQEDIANIIKFMRPIAGRNTESETAEFDAVSDEDLNAFIDNIINNVFTNFTAMYKKLDETNFKFYIKNIYSINDIESTKNVIKNVLDRNYYIYLSLNKKIVDNKQTESLDISIHPNPTIGHAVTIIDYSNLEDGDILLKIKNSYGSEIVEVVPNTNGKEMVNGIFEISLGELIQYNIVNMSFVIIKKNEDGVNTILGGSFLNVKKSKKNKCKKSKRSKRSKRSKCKRIN